MAGWEIPYKWRLKWENQLSMGDPPLPCLIPIQPPRRTTMAAQLFQHSQWVPNGLCDIKEKDPPKIFQGCTHNGI